MKALSIPASLSLLSLISLVGSTQALPQFDKQPLHPDVSKQAADAEPLISETLTFEALEKAEVLKKGEHKLANVEVTPEAYQDSYQDSPMTIPQPDPRLSFESCPACGMG